MIKTGGYFGGANTARGFVNYFGAATKGVERLYILKGGSGCGKNSLMKRAAAEAERRGETVERIYCASDPESLDGVILRERSVGIVDGTSPHELSPRAVGAMDNLVDLGEYWDSAALRGRAEEIKSLMAKKSECYGRAYSLLSACGKLRRERRRITDSALLSDKLTAAAGRYAERLCRKGAIFSAKLRPMYAFCGKGTVRAKAYGERELWAVNDPYDVRGRFFTALTAAFSALGGILTLSPDAIDPACLAAVRHDESGVLFAAEGETQAVRIINMERFVDKTLIGAHRQRFKFLAKAEASLNEAAAAALAEARRYHLALEDIYIPTMDFDRVNARAEKVIKEMLA